MSATISGGIFLLLMASILFPFLALLGAVYFFLQELFGVAFFLLMWWIIWAE